MASTVAEVDAAGWLEGQGPRADAMVTRRPGVALGIVTADCAPVLFADPVAGVIGAAHAGWRSALGGVLEATIAAMAALGAAPRADHRRGGPLHRPGELRGRRRPARGGAGARRRRMPATSAPGRGQERWQFDLSGYCAARLAAAGLARVETADTDTLAENERFFSHRRRMLAGGGPIGHQLSAIALPA